jgi:hypothetical protein
MRLLSSRTALALGVLALAGGCTGVLGSFEISNDGGPGGGTNGEGGTNGADGATSGDGASSDAAGGTSEGGGGMIVDGSLVDAAPVDTCTLNGNPTLLDNSGAAQPFVRLFLSGSGNARIVNEQTSAVKAWQVAGTTVTPLDNDPQFTSVLAVKRIGTSISVLGLNAANTLGIATIDDMLTSFASPITLNNSQTFVTGSFIPAATMAAVGDSGAGVPATFFAANVDPKLYAGATVLQSGVNIATGASGADMNIVNVLDSASNFHVFTAGSAISGLAPTRWALAPDTVPVNVSAHATKQALVDPGDKAAQLLAVGSVGSGNGFGVAFGEAAPSLSLTIRAGKVASLASSFTAHSLPAVIVLGAADLPTGKGFDARWETNQQLIIAGPPADLVTLGLDLLWYDANQQVVRANLTGTTNRLFKGTNVLAASATVNDAGMLFIAWVDGKHAVYYQTATCK